MRVSTYFCLHSELDDTKHNSISMEKKEKLFYEAPVTMVFTVVQEGVICASGDPDGKWFGNEEDM